MDLKSSILRKVSACPRDPKAVLFPGAYLRKIAPMASTNIAFYIYYLLTSVDTEMCCPKGKCGCQYFILLTLKTKIHGHRGPGFFQYKANPGLLFLLKVRSCVFISNFHHSPPPPPKGYKIVSLIIN